MGRLQTFVADSFLRFTVYTYSNLSRLFIRLFVSVMFMQFGIRQLVNYHSLTETFPTVFGMSPVLCLNLMIIIELVCSLCIMLGFMTRLSTLPPILSMILAEYYIISDMLGDLELYGLDSVDPGYLPILFIGIYIYILLAGPGRISFDYFISLRIIEARGSAEEEELEEV